MSRLEFPIDSVVVVDLGRHMGWYKRVRRCITLPPDVALCPGTNYLQTSTVQHQKWEVNSSGRVRCNRLLRSMVRELALVVHRGFKSK